MKKKDFGVLKMNGRLEIRKSSREKDGEKRKKEWIMSPTSSENVRKSEALNLSSEENY